MRMTTHHHTPWGWLAVDGDRALTAVRFTAEPHAQLAHEGVHAEFADQLGQYLAGTRDRFELPLAWPDSTAWTIRVGAHLAASVAAGRTTSYQRLAADLGRPTASRAVGGAMRANPLVLVVPCHRVLAARGLGGFSGGTDRKEAMLAFEAARYG